jgi:predicted PurR-regulated permease PerM
MSREVRLSRFEQLRARVRQAYESGRASIRAGGRGGERFGVPGPARSAGSIGPLPAATVGGPAAPVPVESAGAEAPSPVDPHPSTSSRDDENVPHGLRIAAAWSWRLIVIGVVLWALIGIIGRVRIVIIPLAIALLISALLAPAVGWLLRARVPRSLATAVVLVTGVAAVVGTLTMVVNQFIKGVPDLSDGALAGIQEIQNWLREGPLHVTDGQLDSYIEQGQQWIDENTQALTTGALSTATTIFEVFTGALLVIFTMFFFLRDGGKIWRFLVRLLPAAAQWRVDDAGRASWETLGSYVRATVLVAVIDAVGIGIFLVIFDIPFAFPLTALIFLGAFIPIVGAALSGAVAVLVALVDSGWVIALVILGVVIGVQQVEGNILQPLIMGRAVALHPLAVLLAITVGVVLAGIVGALVAVPLIAVVNTAVRRLAHRGPPAVPPDAVLMASDHR